MTISDSRRRFIKNAFLGSAAALSIPSILSAATAGAEKKKHSLSDKDIILFQGDSITDSGRNRDDNSFNSPRALGNGYAMLAAASLLETHAGLDLKIYNKGISGNKVFQLAERWDKDCLDIKPTVLSILIGVNDIWHKLNGQYNGTVEIYRRDYKALIERTLTAQPGIKLVICEPFAVSGVKAVDEKWYPEFNDYRQAAADVANEFKAVFVPFQKIFDEASKQAPGSYWTGDGVHPSLAGAQLMASAWLESVK